MSIFDCNKSIIENASFLAQAVIALLSLISIWFLRIQLKEASETIKVQRQDSERQRKMDRKKVEPKLNRENITYSNNQFTLTAEWLYNEPLDFRVELQTTAHSDMKVISTKIGHRHPTSAAAIPDVLSGSVTIAIGSVPLPLISLKFSLGIYFKDILDNLYRLQTHYNGQSNQWVWEGAPTLVE